MNIQKIPTLKRYTYVSFSILSILLSSKIQAMNISLEENIDYPTKGGYMTVPSITKGLPEELESSNLLGPKAFADSYSSYDWETEPFGKEKHNLNKKNSEEETLPKKTLSQKAKKFFKKNGLKIVSTGVSLFRGIVTLINILDKN